MSAPPTALPAQIAELMTVDVIWEASLGQDGYAQSAYDDPVTLKGWVEPYGSYGGILISRTGDTTVALPSYELYFDGDDERAQSFTILDRFTLPSAVETPTRPLQPIKIGTLAPPPFDNEAPWLIQVTV